MGEATDVLSGDGHLDYDLPAHFHGLGRRPGQLGFLGVRLHGVDVGPGTGFIARGAVVHIVLRVALRTAPVPIEIVIVLVSVYFHPRWPLQFFQPPWYLS